MASGARVAAAVLLGVLAARAAGDAKFLVTNTIGDQALFTIDPATAAVTRAPEGLGVEGSMAGLAWDAASDRLYGTTTFSNNLHLIDPATGRATVIGSLGVPLIHGLAFNLADGLLYGVRGEENMLYRIDPATAAATAVGTLSISGLSGLDFNPAGRLIASRSAGGGALYEIDPSTGAATFLVATHRLTGITFHPESGALYGVDNLPTENGDGDDVSRFFSVDFATGAATLIGDMSIENALGFEIIPAPSSAAAFALGLLSRRTRRGM